jgi:hypothetical protein
VTKPIYVSTEQTLLHSCRQRPTRLETVYTFQDLAFHRKLRDPGMLASDDAFLMINELARVSPAIPNA